MRLQLRQTKEFLRNMDNKVTGILRLGVLRPILPSILKQFLEQYPDVEVRVMTDWSSNLVHSVYSQHVHIGMLRGDYDWPDGKHLMMEENICIVSKHEIHLQDLPSLPRINYKTEPSLKNTMDLWWKERYSLPPNIAMEVDKMETGKEMVLNGLGYAILPTIVLGGQEDLYKINLTSKHGEPWKRKSWMIYRKESLNLTLIKEFVDFMKNRDLETPKRR
ncbi:substrate-binding domain-containing protein [Paenibacillus melissococcoides]|uniref:Substrate-binding domain-containing protein n=2 Tax=Paenibacillus TaxID=44249 RepID=A0ABM9FWI6_9BACL|nr:putative HTH-type transcriptional regulator YkuM [Paenibacillus dendritiformis]CAH8243212.1 substrate-binding domain-containing protein [Paenibacillus melissococcoides]